MSCQPNTFLRFKNALTAQRNTKRVVVSRNRHVSSKVQVFARNRFLASPKSINRSLTSPQTSKCAPSTSCHAFGVHTDLKHQQQSMPQHLHAGSSTELEMPSFIQL